MFTDNIKNFPTSIYNQDASSNLGKIYTNWASQLDEFQFLSATMNAINCIDEMDSLNLDRIGSLLGEMRGAKTDLEYRIYIKISIQKMLSKGDINSINSISSLILKNSLLLREEFGGIPIRFDGSRVFDGSWKFTGSTREPATIIVEFADTPDKIQINSDFVYAINQIRAGGVKAKIEYTIDLDFSNFTLFTNTSKRFDGSWKFDGRKKFRGDKIQFNIEGIAIGNDGLFLGLPKIPTGLETGLSNELIRKNVFVGFQNGEKIYTIIINFSEQNNFEFNEAMVYTDSGLILALINFPSITKNSGYILNFKLRGFN